MHSHAIIISKYITYIKSLNDTRDRKCSNSFKDIRLINVSFRHFFFSSYCQADTDTDREKREEKKKRGKKEKKRRERRRQMSRK